MSTTVTVEKTAWVGTFARLTEERSGQTVVIEVLDEELGDQTLVDGLPLADLDVDPQGRVLVVACCGHESSRVVLRHMVRDLEQVDLVDQPAGRLVVRIVDAKGVQTLLSLQPQATLS